MDKRQRESKFWRRLLVKLRYAQSTAIKGHPAYGWSIDEERLAMEECLRLMEDILKSRP
jgi:hypothetical protein